MVLRRGALCDLITINGQSATVSLRSEDGFLLKHPS